MKNKNLTIGTVRGIAIILVIYGHVIQRSMSAGGGDFFLNPVFKIIYTFHLPLFVFISGYLMTFSLSKRSVSEVFKTRCKSLLVPYVSWGILGIMTNYFLNIIDGKNIGVINFPWDLLDQLLLNPAVWFLFTLFILSCILLYSVKLQPQFGTIIFIVIYFLILIIPYNNYCSLYFIKWFYLFYMTGYFINKCGIKITNKFIDRMVFFISLIMFGIFASYWTKNDYIYINKLSFISNQYFDEILRIIYRYIMGFLGILIAFHIGTYFSNTKVERSLGYIGIYSLDIYLIQRYIVEGIYPRIVYNAHINFDCNSPFFLCVFAPLVTTLFVGTCILISKLLLRRNYLLNRLLLGDRI